MKKMITQTLVRGLLTVLTAALLAAGSFMPAHAALAPVTVSCRIVPGDLTVGRPALLQVRAEGVPFDPGMNAFDVRMTFSPAAQVTFTENTPDPGRFWSENGASLGLSSINPDGSITAVMVAMNAFTYGDVVLFTAPFTTSGPDPVSFEFGTVQIPLYGSSSQLYTVETQGCTAEISTGSGDYIYLPFVSSMY